MTGIIAKIDNFRRLNWNRPASFNKIKAMKAGKIDEINQPTQNLSRDYVI
jgi:hypothetical protein